MVEKIDLLAPAFRISQLNYLVLFIVVFKLAHLRSVVCSNAISQETPETLSNNYFYCISNLIFKT